MKLKVVYKIWTIDWLTFKGKGSSFSIEYGPFASEQQARWFWLSIKEQMQTAYDYAVILDENGKDVFIDESYQVQPY